MISFRVHNTGGVRVIQGASHLSSSSCRQNQNHLNLYENINQRKKTRIIEKSNNKCTIFLFENVNYFPFCRKSC